MELYQRAASRGPKNYSGVVFVFSDRAGAGRTQVSDGFLLLRRSAHISAHWLNWLFHRSPLRHAVAAADAGLSRDRGVLTFVLLAQAFLRGARRHHLGNVRAHDIFGGRSGLLRTSLDRYDTQRCQSAAAARSQSGP